MSRVFEQQIMIKTSNLLDQTNNDLIFKATELTLGLPGFESPKRVVFYDEVSGFSDFVSGSKRGFSDTINGVSDKWVLPKNGVCVSSSVLVDDDQKLEGSSGCGQGVGGQDLSKAQVVGWPPIRSFRRNSMAVNTPKTDDEKEVYVESGCLFIKVSMDGAPYLRKVDLKMYGSYVELSSALEKMFSGFTTGQHCDKKVLDQDKFSRDRLMDDLHSSEYVLTYEDKDGDWMLVGDVPWNMFMGSCRRLRIMKSTEAVGLASRAT